MEGSAAVATSSPEWRRPTSAANPIGSLLLGNEKASSRPPLGPLDLDAARRDSVRSNGSAHPLSADRLHRPPPVTTSAIHPPPPPLVSPQSVHSGPPPPYSYPSSASSSMLNMAAYMESPDSRRASDADNKDPPPPPPPPASSTIRQSLPSIHEALGKDPAILYSGPPPSATVSAPSTDTAYPTTSSILSPTTPAPRSHPEPTLPGPPNPYATSNTQPLPPYSSTGELHATHAPSPAEWRAAAPPTFPTPTRPSHEPNHHVPSHHAHPPYAASPTSPRDPRFSPAFSNISAGPPPPVYAAPATHFPPPPPPPSHSYRPHQSHPSQPAAYSHPSPGRGTAPFAPQTVAPAPAPAPAPPARSTQLSQPWRTDGVEPERRGGYEAGKTLTKGGSGGGQHYGEKVKRQLDVYDVETALNEIAENSGRACEFTQHFGRQAHQAQRDPSQMKLPALEDIDEMMRRQEVVLSAFNRIRGVVVTHQQALAEQQQQQQQQQQRQHEQQQRQHEQQAKNGTDVNITPTSAKGLPADGLGLEAEPNGAIPLAAAVGAGGAGGFAGADPKKRKGRSAAPGRCHSCNRAETPEWRRGPDGARTLCNACGLHYAKITRKMGNKNTTMGGSSDIRPKGPGGSP